MSEIYKSFVAAQAEAIRTWGSTPADARTPERITFTVVDAHYGARVYGFARDVDDYTMTETVVLVLSDYETGEVWTVDTRERIAEVLWEMDSIPGELAEAVEGGDWSPGAFELMKRAGLRVTPATVEECFQ